MRNISTHILMFLVILGAVCLAFTFIVPITNLPENTELNYTGSVSDIEFLGGGLLAMPNTLVRFDNGDTILFRYHKTDIPLDKEVKFYYTDNGFGYLFLDRFEVI